MRWFDDSLGHHVFETNIFLRKYHAIQFLRVNDTPLIIEQLLNDQIFTIVTEPVHIVLFVHVVMSQIVKTFCDLIFKLKIATFYFTPLFLQKGTILLYSLSGCDRIESVVLRSKIYSFFVVISIFSDDIFCHNLLIRKNEDDQ